MLEYLVIISIVVSLIVFFKWLHKVSKITKMLIVDNCAECPFMRSEVEFEYKCSAKAKNEKFGTMKVMNESCEFGGKIEIKISEK